MGETEWIKLAMQGGALLVVAWLVFYTHRYTIPDRDKQFHEQIRDQRQELVAEIRDTRKESALVHDRHAEALDRLCDSITALECHQKHRT